MFIFGVVFAVVAVFGVMVAAEVGYETHQVGPVKFGPPLAVEPHPVTDWSLSEHEKFYQRLQAVAQTFGRPVTESNPALDALSGDAERLEYKSALGVLIRSDGDWLSVLVSKEYWQGLVSAPKPTAWLKIGSQEYGRVYRDDGHHGRNGKPTTFADGNWIRLVSEDIYPRAKQALRRVLEDDGIDWSEEDQERLEQVAAEAMADPNFFYADCTP